MTTKHNRFVPTHTIDFGGKRTEVMARPSVDGGATLLYTREEWRSETNADWTAGEDGTLEFQGSIYNVPDGTSWRAIP